MEWDKFNFSTKRFSFMPLSFPFTGDGPCYQCSYPCCNLCFTLCRVLWSYKYTANYAHIYTNTKLYYIHKYTNTQKSLYTNTRLPAINALIAAAISALCWVSQQKQPSIIVTNALCILCCIFRVHSISKNLISQTLGPLHCSVMCSYDMNDNTIKEVNCANKN